ncbi:hypothetical protein YC2023_048952 [Brassica napus]
MDFTEMGLFIASNVQFYKRSPIDYALQKVHRRWLHRHKEGSEMLSMLTFTWYLGPEEKRG